MARELITQFDAAQETRVLSEQKILLRADLKKQSLGLASLSRMIARSRSRIRFLGEREMQIPKFSTYRPVTGVEKTTSPPLSMKDAGSRRKRKSRTSSSTTTTPS
jgi:hypothetical protein